MSRLRIASGITLAMLATAPAATELEYGISAGVGTSDNIRRVPVNEEDETILSAGLDLRLIRDAGRVDADIEANLSYFDYQDDTFDNEVLGMADADVRYAFIPDTFEWVFADTFGQTSLDPFLAATPENRENINYFTTGPDLTIRLGARGYLTLLGRYSSTWYEESNFDDERVLGGISIGRDLSARSSLSLNATTERFEFKEVGVGSNYDRQLGFIRYEMEDARTRLRVDAGYSVLRDFDDTSDSPLFDLDYSRDISDRSTISLRGGVQLSDAASAIRAEGGIGSNPGLPEQISTSDPFEARRIELGWQFNARRTRIILAAGYGEDIYERLSQFDRESNFLYASAERDITPRLSLRAEASHNGFEYTQPGQDDEERRLGITLSWNLTGHLYMQAYVERYDRSSSDALTEFDESRIFLLFAWRNRGLPTRSI